MTTRHGRLFVSLLLLCGLTTVSRAAEPKPLEFHVTFDKSVTDKPFTGRVYVMLSNANLKGPPGGVNWFRPEPFFARDVKDWKPGDKLVIGADSLGYPAPLKELSPGIYSAVAIMDFDRGISFSRNEGNGCSMPVRKELEPSQSGVVELKIDQVVKPTAFPETERVKLVEIESKLLSDFHKRPIKLRAGVALPKSFTDDKDKKYPVLYEIPGFSGNHYGALGGASRTNLDGVEFLYVVLDPNCRTGHHVFADSANNGPCGQALIEELIPEIEKRFRGIGKPGARLLTGHSSGGWSSLWLQVAYPDFFGGVWSTAPDPVDFRDFQRIDVYKPGNNMFTDADGKPRPIARSGGKPSLFYKPFSDMEDVMGHGGQLMSFEAVFSPRGPDGQPMKLWDRKTGNIDPMVAQAWEKYDLRLVLERNWKALGPKLQGKLHVYMGDEDTFYLEGATRLLGESLKQLGSDAVVELFPGKNHGSLMTTELRQRISKEMADQFRKGQKQE
jgi:hypothetical protein